MLKDVLSKRFNLFNDCIHGWDSTTRKVGEQFLSLVGQHSAGSVHSAHFETVTPVAAESDANVHQSTLIDLPFRSQFSFVICSRVPGIPIGVLIREFFDVGHIPRAAYRNARETNAICPAENADDNAAQPRHKGLAEKSWNVW